MSHSRLIFLFLLSADDFPLESIFLAPFLFLYSRVDGIYFIFGVWLESKVPFPSCPRYFRLSFPIWSRRCLIQDSFSYFFFPLTGRRCHFRFRVPAYHLASISFLPPSGDSLGLLYVTPYPILYPSGHQVQTSVFPFWPGFVTLGLTHIISLNGQSLTACYC